MQYDKLTLLLPRRNTEEVAERLCVFGYPAFEIEDYRDLNANTPWCPGDYVDEALRARKESVPRIHFYFEKDGAGDEAARLMDLLQTDAFSDVEFSLTRADDAAWRERYKAFFVPFPVGERLFVLPPWEQDALVPAGRIPLWIDPSAAFGSGTHATTQLALRAVERLMPPGVYVLDIGCGSGILSVAALLFGAARVTALDIDPQALSVARATLKANAIEQSRAALLCADAREEGVLRGERYDFVCANLVSELIIELSERLFSLCAPGAILCASGILETDIERVKGALLAAGFSDAEITQQDDWCAVSAHKR